MLGDGQRGNGWIRLRLVAALSGERYVATDYARRWSIWWQSRRDFGVWSYRSKCLAHEGRRLPRIKISTAGDITNVALVKSICDATGQGVGAIAQALRSGGAIYDADLFDNQTAERFAVARRLLSVLAAARIEPIIHEGASLIDATTLENIIQSAEDSRAESDRLSELGHRP